MQNIPGRKNVLTSLLIMLLQLVAIYWVGTFLFYFIVVGFIPLEVLDTKYDFVDWLSFVCAAVFSVSAVGGLSFNKLRSSRENAKAAKSNAEVVKAYCERLLEKANRVADKYMEHEQQLFAQVVKERAGCGQRVKSAAQFRAVVEAYPQLRANENVLHLLEQIERAETKVSDAQILYNTKVEEYNALLHTFPGLLLKGRAKEMEYYNNEEITDEELGLTEPTEEWQASPLCAEAEQAASGESSEEDNGLTEEMAANKEDTGEEDNAAQRERG